MIPPTSLACERRRRRKAWGVSPRYNTFEFSTREAGDRSISRQSDRPFHGLAISIDPNPGAYAPGFTLAPASQASPLLRQDVACDLDAVFEVLFSEDMADVIFDSANADAKLGSDFLVAQA